MDTLDQLLDQLCHGDDACAERVFLAYEPYLRLVVRRMLPAQLRSKFDSVDVVQSVWVDVLQGFRASGWRFASSAQLKAFLIKATRNRFLDRVRQQRVPLKHQQSLDSVHLQQTVSSDQPDPGAVAQANELWQRMLSLCPQHHQQLLELKRQGCSLSDIAAQTGFHPSSIRRIFYDLARRLGVKSEPRRAIDRPLAGAQALMENGTMP
jgi:RNA polymerase sigma-70 factor (ECF subfamily)